MDAQWQGEYDVQTSTDNVSGLVAGLAPTIRGLEKGDYNEGGKEVTEYLVVSTSWVGPSRGGLGGR